MNVNNKINLPSFWQPVTFTDQTPNFLNKSSFENLMWRIGSLADQIIYARSEKENFKIYNCNRGKYTVKFQKADSISSTINLLKIVGLAVTLFAIYQAPLMAIVPATFLIAKSIFKYQLSKFINNLNDSITEETQKKNNRSGNTKFTFQATAS